MDIPSAPVFNLRWLRVFVPVVTLLTMSSGIAVTTEYQDAADGFVADE